MREVLVSARIEEDLREELKKLAKENERSFSAEMRRALRIYVLSEKAKAAAA
jgi:predicted transcriptional regulator